MERMCEVKGKKKIVLLQVPHALNISKVEKDYGNIAYVEMYASTTFEPSVYSVTKSA
jgi:hypothetical protein